jgi:3-carboxymethyl-3-hydroxy-acyl-[acp] dehydratase
VIAGPHATFGLPECLFGLIPAMVFPVLARRIGHTRSRWLALSARTLTVEEAFRIGLVDEMAEDLEAALDRHTSRLERLDRQAMAATKRIAAQHASTDVAYQEWAASLFQQLLDRSETRERISRFLEGGTPWPDRGMSAP